MCYFSNHSCLIGLALVLLVVTTSVKRVFAVMNAVKTDLRNKMGYGWMNDRMVIYIKKEVLETIENKAILQYFLENITSLYVVTTIKTSQSIGHPY